MYIPEQHSDISRKLYCAAIPRKFHFKSIGSLAPSTSCVRSLALVASAQEERTDFNMAAAGKKKSKGGLDHEQIIMQFNQMRQEYRGIMGKIGELEMEVNEHG